MFEKLVQSVESKFDSINSENLRRVFILLYFWGMFFPLLRDWGVYALKPIAVVSECENISKILGEMLHVFPNSNVVSMSDVKKNWQKRLIENCGDIAIFSYRKSQQADHGIQQMLNILDVGEVDGTEICALPVLCFRCIMPVEQRRNFFVINIERNDLSDKKISLLSDEIFSKFVDCAVEKQTVLAWEVEHFLEEYCEGFENATEKALLASAVIWRTFLDMAFGKVEAESEFLKCVGAVRELVNRNEAESDMDGIEQMFTNLFLYQAREKDTRIYDKAMVPLDYDKMKKYVIFDECAYYISEQFLKDVCAPLLESVGIGAIKKQLVEVGILISNQTQDENYTVKVALCFPHGNMERKRLIRLNRDKIDVPGQPDLTVRKENVDARNETWRNVRMRCLPPG